MIRIRRANERRRPDVLPVTLALEGGGAMGAFAWGAIERLLDAPGLRIGAVSGASAGAMNAALLVQGLATGGAAEAKRLLELFWRRVAVAAGSLDGPTEAWFHMLSSAMAPVVGALRGATNSWAPGPAGANPLAGVLEGVLDPTAFGRPGAPTLVVSATRVRTGEARLFRDGEVTPEVLLASACLPQLFPPVEIDGEIYWDGGYSSNPPVRPLIEAGAPPDIVIVRTTPIERPEVPASAARIQERTHEIAFGTALRQELRSLAVAQVLLSGMHTLPPPLARLRAARLHMIGAEEEFREVAARSKLYPTWAFLQRMRGLGAEAVDRFLAEQGDALGRRSTMGLCRFARPLLPDLAGDGVRPA
ncbi:Patatin-like phospholipase family protein [Rhodovastum atsumiense]|nr:patatin-like phospholipase family protein [Rhodovastum atsumiense]CAH2604442.1 Patatin-like phospholipase family protein [Rhodovastum atsumiense]